MVNFFYIYRVFFGYIIMLFKRSFADFSSEMSEFNGEKAEEFLHRVVEINFTTKVASKSSEKCDKFRSVSNK